MKKTTTYQTLAGVAAVLIVLVYFLPIWHVALQSIQYPKSMYPRGIRIDFKYNGVYNGCKGEKERAELAQSQQGADCLGEMNRRRSSSSGDKKETIYSPFSSRNGST